MSDAASGSSLPVLLVDDEVDILESFEMMLHSGGIRNIECCQDSRLLMPLLAEREFALILLDLSMPHISGEQLLPRVAGRCPDLPVIIVTAASEVASVVTCMRQGAFDYMVKPVDQQRLLTGVRKAIEVRELRRENVHRPKRAMTRERLRGYRYDLCRRQHPGNETSKGQATDQCHSVIPRQGRSTTPTAES